MLNSRMGKAYGMDPKTILATSHGRRSIDIFQQIDPTHATWDCALTRSSKDCFESRLANRSNVM
jgi:hypothetical protein